MKKFINDPNCVEDEMLNGLIKAFPNDLERLNGFDVILRKNKKINKVALVSGGGSGHEPAHAGYVGEGMLDAAVCGKVFTSPTPDQVYEAIKAVNSGKGVLLIIKNYTGDIMNFDMAAEMAEMEGIKVDKVVVADDVAVKDSLYTVGRRGVAGTVFVHKITGAKAEEGAELEEVKATAEKVIANVRTMGVALAPCTVPAAGVPGFEIEDNQMEMGIGIHGEPGVYKHEVKPINDIVDELLDNILGDLDYTNREVAVMVNGSGATPYMELCIANNRISDVLKQRGVNVYRTFIGNYMTSLEMAGLSITLLRLDDETKRLLDQKANTIGYKEF